ncbi:hypothetical protein FB451DRAFT_1396227 [Mycena latifolia]|nr:hypothetical protein FB451DRAFT_1396227 [Mycena latifolia]
MKYARTASAHRRPMRAISAPPLLHAGFELVLAYSLLSPNLCRVRSEAQIAAHGDAMHHVERPKRALTHNPRDPELLISENRTQRKAGRIAIAADHSPFSSYSRAFGRADPRKIPLTLAEATLSSPTGTHNASSPIARPSPYTHL